MEELSREDLLDIAIDANVKKILLDKSSSKLLDPRDGFMIVLLLFDQSKPQATIKDIVRERCLEDLLLMFMLMGPAISTFREQHPQASLKEVNEKCQSIFTKAFCYESPRFAEVIHSMEQIDKAKLQRSTSDFLAFCQTPGFNFDKLDTYISSHREVLSYAFDLALLSFFLTTIDAVDKKETESHFEAFWRIREELAAARERYI